MVVLKGMNQGDASIDIEEKHQVEPLAIGTGSWPLFSGIKDSFVMLAPVLERRWSILFLFLFIDYITKYTFYLGSVRFDLISYENPASLIFASLCQAVIHILVINAWILVTVSGAEDYICKRRFRDWEKLLIKYYNQMIIENIRYLAAIIWRVPFLLIPAFVAFIRLSFFNFVVASDINYTKDKLDALERSKKMTRGAFFITLVAVSVFALLPGLIETLLQPMGPDILESPIWVLSSLLASFIIQTLAILYSYSIYLNLSRRVDKKRSFAIPPQEPETNESH